MKRIDHTNKVFGRLTVKSEVKERHKSGAVQWNCICECGNECIVLATNLIRGVTRSCGCYALEVAKDTATKHGLSYTNEYVIWAGIRSRCYNPKEPAYDRYGGRGILMSDEWRDSVEAFYRDMGPRPSKNHSVERRDNDRGYCEENCYWATRVEQANNRKSNRLIKIGNKIQTMKQWCNELNLDYVTITRRFFKGWPPEEALGLKERFSPGVAYYELGGKKKRLTEWAEEFDINYGTLKSRIQEGMLFEVAIRFKTINSNTPLEIDGVVTSMVEQSRLANCSVSEIYSRMYSGWKLSEVGTNVQNLTATVNDETNALDHWCSLYNVDFDKVVLRFIRGEEFLTIVDSLPA